MNINTVILHGRLTADPDTKIIKDGDGLVTQFTVAVDGYGENTDFIDCKAFDGRADTISKHFTKGKEIALVGRLSTRMYEDKNGNNRKAVEVVVSDFDFCGKKDDGGSGSEKSSGNKKYGNKKYGSK